MAVKSDIDRRRRYVVISFFFFQAEDGIRDLTVTGVQTCALPILLPGMGVARGVAADGLVVALQRGPPLRRRPGRLLAKGRGEGGPHLALPGRGDRSEERRVGKECRSRWSPYH